MKLKRLGNSDVHVTPIAFGAWAIGGWMWGGAEESAAIRAIRASFDAGITTIDTAPVYGFGKSEELVGRAMEGISREKNNLPPSAVSFCSGTCPLLLRAEPRSKP